jgi:hypothetical protein
MPSAGPRIPSHRSPSHRSNNAANFNGRLRSPPDWIILHRLLTPVSRREQSSESRGIRVPRLLSSAGWRTHAIITGHLNTPGRRLARPHGHRTPGPAGRFGNLPTPNSQPQTIAQPARKLSHAGTNSRSCRILVVQCHRNSFCPKSATHLLALGSARTCYRARGAGIATALPFCFFGAAARAAAFDECVGELAELDLRFVRFCQSSGEGFNF